MSSCAQSGRTPAPAPRWRNRHLPSLSRNRIRDVSVADPSDPVRYLDMAGGTGDISFRIAETLRSRSGKPVAAEIVVSDINPSMLGVGEQRARSKGLLDGRGLPAMSFVEADAEALPFESNTFDSYTIAFGIRNVTHVDVSSLRWPLLAVWARFAVTAPPSTPTRSSPLPHMLAGAEGSGRGVPGAAPWRPLHVLGV